MLGYLDDTKEIGTVVDNLPVLGKVSIAWEGGLGGRSLIYGSFGRSFYANSFLRKYSSIWRKSGYHYPPKEFYFSIGINWEGTLISPFCCIWAGARIGRFCLLEVGCHVGVENNLGEGVFLGPSCLLNAACTIGEKSFLGTGTVVIPRKNIGAGRGDWCCLHRHCGYPAQ